MRTNHIGARCAFVVSLFAVATCASGDGPCDVHEVTADEISHITSVLKTMQSALPPPPVGWIIVVDPANEIGGPGTICKETEKTPWSYGFTRTYQQVADAEARGKLFTDQAAAQAAAMKQRQPRLDALQQKMQPIFQQQIALNQKQDYAGAEKLQPQLEAMQKEYEAIIYEAADPAAAAATEKAFNRDRQMKIAVSVNPRKERAGEGATSVAPPAGARSAQRWHIEDENQSNDQALYPFGAWKPAVQGSSQPTLLAGVPPSGAHRLAVLVTGDAERVTQTVATIDFGKLAAIVK